MKRTISVLPRAFLMTLVFILLAGGLHRSYAQQTPFSTGVNLTNWFQAGDAHGIQFNKYTRQDFENIISLGCDVIRLPINLHYMTDGAPDYTLDPLFLNFLDQVAGWAEELELHLILDNHTFDVTSNTDPAVGGILEKVWTQMAQHYRDGYSKLYFEILNEPHGIADNTWNTIQLGVIEAIREVDTVHTIIVGGAGWNSYNNLAAIPEYTDTNLIYTFHFYDPFLFTHQGASWVNPTMEPLAGVPYPYHPDSMPGLPSSLVGTWVGSNYNDYYKTGNDSAVKKLLDIAISFREQRQVPIFCGEFGVYMNNSKNEDRVRWYELVASYLTENEVARTSWDYHGGFGIFEKGSNGLFENDLNISLLEAMGLNTPEQTEYMLKPDSTGFCLYTDYMGPGVNESSYGAGRIDFYSPDNPNNGNYCIRWDNPPQYTIIGFDFKPDKDLSVLVDSGYAFDFMARGNVAGTSFDIRFIDTKTGETDHPWRMTARIDETRMSMDGKWYHINIPLSDFYESGSWDSGTWYNQEGKYDWTAVDRFEIVSEQGGLDQASLWFDNIIVTALDTAQVLESSVFSDTLVAFDTIVLTDIMVHVDSLVDVYTLILLEVNVDTTIVTDSIVQTEIIIFTDTITTTDSIMLVDTVTFFDFVRLADTISHIDTLSYTDTIWINDTIWSADDIISTSVYDNMTGDAGQLWIYPNPFGSQLTVITRRSGPVVLELFDLSGRLVREDRFTGRALVDTQDLPGGVYILRLSDMKSFKKQFRVVKQ